MSSSVMMEWNAKTYFMWRGVDSRNLYVQGEEGMFAASMELYSTTESLDFSLKHVFSGRMWRFLIYISFVLFRTAHGNRLHCYMRFFMSFLSTLPL